MQLDPLEGALKPCCWLFSYAPAWAMSNVVLPCNGGTAGMNRFSSRTAGVELGVIKDVISRTGIQGG